MNRLATAWAWIRSDPQRSALAGTVAVAAVAAGLAVGLVVTNLRSTPPAGSAASDQATPSATASASFASLSPSPTPSASASPSASDEPSPSPDETPAPTTASAPSPTPGGGFGGAVGGEPPDLLEGTWEELADGSRGDTSDSVVLADGRIVVFRWRTDFEMSESNEMTVYDPEDDRWEAVAFEGDPPGVGTDQSFALGGDDRIYTHDYRITIGSDNWRRETFKLVRETETWAGMSLASGSDGRIYYAADDSGPGRTELVIYDPESDAFDRSASVDGRYSYFVAIGDRLAALGHDPSLGNAAIFYDPDADTWSDPTPVDPFDYALVDFPSLAADPNGVIYAPRGDGSVPGLWAIDPEDGSTRPVELPEGVIGSWSVDLVWHDDALYAFGSDQAWRFTPGQ